MSNEFDPLEEDLQDILDFLDAEKAATDKLIEDAKNDINEIMRIE